MFVPLKGFFPPGRQELVCDLIRRITDGASCPNQGGFMEPTKSITAPASDVLHIEAQSKLTPAEVAKALAHHNRHHHGDQLANAQAKSAPGKKNK
jgi:hypothetical protein